MVSLMTCAGETGQAMGPLRRYLFFSLPFGITTVVGAMGRVEVLDDSFGGLLSFLGFFAILLLRWTPLGMVCSSFFPN